LMNGLIKIITIGFLLNIGFGVLAANPFLSPGEGQIKAPPTQSGKALPEWLRDWQLAFKAEAGELLNRYNQGGQAAILWAILASTFLYGVLHALGPGHRKTIVFSLFLGAKTPWWKPLAAGLTSAGIHGGMSLGIVGILSIIKQGISSLMDTEQVNAWVEAISAFLLLGFAALLIILKIVRGHHHHHHGKTSGGMWSILITSSLVPCSGATMVLLTSLYLNMVGVGALAVLTMSLGMGLVVSGAAYLAWGGRTALFQRLKGKEETVHKVSDVLEYGAYGFLLLVGIIAVIQIIDYLLQA
jgi:ABC-type nickel/cobalt efflux system permease component RcnA